MAAPFSMTIKSFQPATETSPLRFTFTTSSTRPNPLFPATYLQPAWTFDCNAQFFVDDVITHRDVGTVDADSDISGGGSDGESSSGGSDVAGEQDGPLYEVMLPGKMAQMKLPKAADGTGRLSLHAWKGQKYLGTYEVGEVENLAVVGGKN